jgi:DNA-binding response OmpR family regulator
MKTVLVVDDEPKLVEVLQAYLEKAGYRVVRAYDGAEALRRFDEAAPDLVLLDLMLPDISGEDVCRAIRRKSRVPVVMLTAKTADEDVVLGLGIGADDYVVKPFSNRQLLARIAAHLRRASEEAVPLAESLSFDGGVLVLDGLRREVRKNGAVLPLTPNEYKIAMTLAKYPTRAFTREELIHFAFGDDYPAFDRAIDSHVKNLRQKIEDEPKRPRYIRTVHGVGYRFGGDGP